MTSERVRIVDGRSVPHIWFNFEVDDLPLDPYELRLYFHIVRRGSKSGLCNESVDNMAKYCRMSSGAAKRSIRKLLELGLIRRESHAGRPSDYVVQDMSDWNIEAINALGGGEPDTAQVVRQPRSSDNLGHQTAATQVATDLGVGHERSRGGSVTTHKVDHSKKNISSNSIEGFSDRPLTPCQQGDVIAPSVRSEAPSQPEPEPHPEMLDNPSPSSSSSVAQPSGSVKTERSACRKSRKTQGKQKGRYAKNQVKANRDYSLVPESERFLRFWAKHSAAAKEFDRNPGSKALSADVWIELIEAGVSINSLAEGYRFWLAAVKASNGIGFVKGEYFLGGKQTHPEPYWQEALRLIQQQPSFEPDEFTPAEPMSQTERLCLDAMAAIADEPGAQETIANYRTVEAYAS